MKLKYFFSSSVALAWSFFIKSLFGTMNNELKTLLLFILIDLITGLIVAGVFKKSQKTFTGALKSSEMTKGICKKIGIILLVIIAHYIDITLNISYIMYVTEVALIIEEMISIIENIGLMGVPIPSVITNSIDLLNKKISEVIK